MAKIKIYEIAKQLELTSKEVVNIANELGLNVTSHLSAVTETEEKKIISSYKENGNMIKNKKTKAEDRDKKHDNKKDLGNDSKKEKHAPVIIRREIICNDEVSEEKKETHKKKNKDVGFVERKQNKDFNIVYRKQPVKPMTVSELFGIKPKNEPKQNEPKQNDKMRNEQNKNKTDKTIEKDIIEKPLIENKKAEINNESKDLGKEKTEVDNLTEKDINKKEMTNNRDNANKNNNNNNKSNLNPKKQFNKNGYQSNNFNNSNANNNYNNYRSNNEHNRDENRSYNQKNNQRNNNQNFEKRSYNNRNNNNYNNGNTSGSGNNYSKQNNFNNRKTRPLDNHGIEKNIKEIIETDIVEKEDRRDISTRVIDKEKAMRSEMNKAKKGTKTKKNNRYDENYDEEKLKDLKQVDKLSNMFEDQNGGMLDYYDLTTERGKKNKRKLPKTERNKQKIFELKEISISENITVKDLATELKKTSAEIIKKLFGYGIMATLNNTVDFDTAFLIAEEFGVKANKKTEVNEEDILFDDSEDKEEDLVARPPVVVVMGHVDHGKTSLLDAIRSTNVIEGEAGGITQHIGAYKVNIKGREITFLDTPGHEAFTAMRARGAQVTDVAILIVAANDGVMPQTIEAINHAKAADIPIIVAVNKIDLPEANIDRVKQQLMEYELVPEEWGGDTIYVPISAKKGINIDNLLEMVLLVSDMKELKANPNKQAKGTVLEARLDKAKGPIASMLVQRGTLDVGDTVVVGKSIGRIRAMKNDKGQKVKKAGPSTPVEIMGLTEVPEAGDVFYEVKNEKMAKHLIEKRKRQEKEKAANEYNKVTLNNLFEKMESESLKQLNVIVKADVQGTAQALKQSLEKLSNDEIKVKVIHAVAGAVTESDVQLAKAGNCIIIAFNVRPVNTAKEMAEKENVEIKQYSIIYQALEDVEAAMKGMLDPIYEEKVIGNAVVRQTFKVSNVGTIAGAFVTDGKIERNAGVRVIRENVVIHDGKLISLKRFKDDVKEVSKGFECGLQIEGYNDVKEDDILEFYIMEEVKR